MPQPHVFDWNGFISAETPGIEFWRWSKSAVTAADQLVEGAIESVDHELNLKSDSYPDPESYGEAQYYLVEEPASFARSALFCQLAGSFEFALMPLCSDAATATNATPIQARFSSEVVLNRLRYLQERTGIDFPSNSAEVLMLTKLRSIFAHADGMPTWMDDGARRGINSWLQQHTELVDATGHAIKLKSGFVRYCLSQYDSKLEAISAAIVEKCALEARNHPQGKSVDLVNQRYVGALV